MTEDKKRKKILIRVVKSGIRLCLCVCVCEREIYIYRERDIRTDRHVKRQRDLHIETEIDRQPANLPVRQTDRADRQRQAEQGIVRETEKIRLQSGEVKVL